MIELIQHKINSTDLSANFNKLNEFTVTVNKDIIRKDIDRLKKDLTETKNKYNKANINGLLAYLEKILKHTDEESKFDICWVTESKDGLPYTYPLQLVNEPLYGINTCNYIELDSSEKLIEINLADLADIIAFEFMYKDLGESHESVEELLKDCGIIGFEKSDLLINFFKENGDNLFELSKTMMIDDSPYKSSENRTIIDYFHSKEFKDKSYREVVDYSCRYANTAIANSILKNYLRNDINVKLIAVSATNITLIVDSDNEVEIDEIAIRVFGRRFLIEPKISVL